MDDPGSSWPYWKFGLKRDDLFTKLHNQYNTFPSAIQDPEAFHLDVYELSSEANTLDEFNRLMSDRKAQRLDELNGLLESASLEIIANPNLIGTEQWQHALQLFRTKSLDSLVRYFASYLPDGHPWHRDSGSKISTGYNSEPIDNYYGPILFDDDDWDKHVLTDEPNSFSTKSIPSHMPPSPRSMTMCSQDSAVDSTGYSHHKYNFDTITPARTLSFSESEPDRFASIKDSIPILHDEETSQSHGPLTPTSSISDKSELDASQGKDLLDTEIISDDAAHDVHAPMAHVHKLQTMEHMESDTPAPKPQDIPKSGSAAPATSFFDTILPSVRHRNLAPTRTHPHHVHACLHDCRQPRISTRQLRRKNCSPDGRWKRRRNPLEGACRSQNLIPDVARSRPRGRRPVEQ